MNTQSSSPSITRCTTNVNDKRNTVNMQNSNHGSDSQPSSSLADLLNRSLPNFITAPNHTTSTETREPKYFDMHLHPMLQLQKVKFVDGLAAAIFANCEPYFSLLDADDLCALERIYFMPKGTCLDETSVQDYLLNLGSAHCKLASRLLFQKGWLPVFECSPRPKGSESFQHAVADSYSSITSDDEVLKCLSEEDKQDITLMEQHGFHNFSTEEYKNILCGESFLTPDVMQSQAGDFAWTTCNAGGSRCKSRTHRSHGRIKLTGRRTGPDSLDPDIEKLLDTSTDGLLSKEPSSTCAEHTKPQAFPPGRPSDGATNTKFQKQVMHAHNVLQQAWTSAVAQDITFLVLSSGNIEYIGIRHRDQQTLFLSSPIKPSDAMYPSYIKLRVALCIAAYKDALRRASKLENLLHSKVASPLVKYRLELDEQPHMPEAKVTDSGIGQSKPKRLSQRMKPRTNTSKRLGFVASEDQSKLASPTPRSKVQACNKPFKPKIDKAQLKLSDKDVIEKLRKSTLVSLWLKGFNLSLTQFNSEVWILSREESTVIQMPPDEGWTVHLDLDSELDGNRAYKVYLRIVDQSSNSTTALSRPLVLKKSWDKNDAKALRREHENYIAIGEVDALLEQFGLFFSEVGPSDKRSFLLMEHGGDSIYSRMNNSTKNGIGSRKDTSKLLLKSSAKYRKAFMKSLKTLHGKGWIHNSINPKHILLGTSHQKAALISLKLCIKPSKDLFESLKRAEIQAVIRCLGISPAEEAEMEREGLLQADDPYSLG